MVPNRLIKINPLGGCEAKEWKELKTAAKILRRRTVNGKDPGGIGR